MSLQERLETFVSGEDFLNKGPLCVALVITDRVKSLEFPLSAEQFITDRSGGQVVGLGRAAVQKILHRHGISRVLAREGGRTSRGSINNMRAYVRFLNGLHSAELLDLQFVEAFWIGQVERFFAAKPFKLRVDPSQGLRMVVRNVLGQAAERERRAGGTRYVGAVMQHLVGAKLDCAIGVGQITHHSSSASDQQTSRAGDFLLGDTAIHVTTSPGEALISRCKDNLDGGLHPVIVTGQNGIAAAELFAHDAGLSGRIDTFEIEQFLALNIYELGKFAASGHRAAVGDVVRRYNEIIEDVETDPSLRIEES